MTDSDRDIDSILQKLNKIYALTSFGGKAKIIYEIPCPLEGLNSMQLLDEEDFKIFLMNKTLTFSDPEGVHRVVTYAELWLAHPKRRTYAKGMGCYPKGAPTGVFNTFRHVYPDLTGTAHGLGKTCAGCGMHEPL